MQRLRVLTSAAALLAIAGCAKDPGSRAEAAQPAPKAAAAATAPGASGPGGPSGPSGPSAPQVPKLKVGETFDFATELAQVHPSKATVRLDRRNGRPLAIFLWGTGSMISREDLVAFDAFVAKEKLRDRMDVYSLAGFSAEKGSAADVKDMAVILGVREVPVLADPEFALANRIGAEQYPDITVVGADGKVIAKGIHGLDHGNLQPAEMPGAGGTRSGPFTGEQYLLRVAAEKNGPVLPRTFPFYPADRLKGRRFVDAEMPVFSPEGWGKGERVKISKLLSGKRPAVVMFFSSTCDHCQVDVPQIVKLEKEQPDLFDLVGITRIRNPNHRAVSAKYFKDQGITFPVLEDTGAITDAYQVVSTPTDFYLSPQGAITSVSYYQHQDLAADWTKLHPKLVGAAPPAKDPKSATGWAFPMSARDEAGKKVELASFAGKPTLVHFWATWCVPCRKELPDLLKAMPQLEAAGRVVLVAVKDKAENVAKYRQDTGLQIRTLLDPEGGLADSIDFGRSVPRTYLLDAAGRVQVVYQGSYDWADPEKLARALGRMER